MRYSELELVLTKERAAQHQQHIELQTMQKERDELKSEVGRLTARISGMRMRIMKRVELESQIATLKAMTGVSASMPAPMSSGISTPKAT